MHHLKMYRIQCAYEILSDKKSRDAHDSKLRSPTKIQPEMAEKQQPAKGWKKQRQELMQTPQYQLRAEEIRRQALQRRAKEDQPAGRRPVSAFIS